jgi:hypothetical protein
MTTTTTPMNDRNVAFFTISRKDAAALIRDLASALAESESIDMEFRTNRTKDFSKMGDFEDFHEIRLGLRNSFSNASGVITESATWE